MELAEGVNRYQVTMAAQDTIPISDALGSGRIQTCPVKGIVREVRLLLDALKRQGFYISDELYQHVLRMAGEL